MNMFLLGVTSLSLILAATMAAVAWRLARDERRRSQARVATLASDLDLDMRGRTRRCRPLVPSCSASRSRAMPGRGLPPC